MKCLYFFFFQAEDGIRDGHVTGVQTCALPILVADGTDNFRTRYLLNDMCVQMKRTLVSAALLRFDGQLGVFKPHAGPNFPCYRCIFPEEPPADLIPRCETAGI